MITEADIKRMDQAMKDATEVIQRLKEQNQILVRIAIETNKKYELLREWARGFQS